MTQRFARLISLLILVLGSIPLSAQPLGASDIVKKADEKVNGEKSS
jgi:hypothetical protein